MRKGKRTDSRSPPPDFGSPPSYVPLFDDDVAGRVTRVVRSDSFFFF